MEQNDSLIPWITRRDLLAQSARGAALMSVAPYLGHAQALLARDIPAPRVRDSFDFGWKFLLGDAP
jgi:hypothetical protein